MRNREDLLGEILSRIADELNITDSMFAKAEASYRSVGKWIGDGINYKTTIMPQGSMNLGTVVRPLNDQDDYDIDLVCLLEDGNTLTAKSVKTIVGERLKENETYRKKLDSEGRRCWTMQYDEFHMDILPCIPEAEKFVIPGATQIALTDKDKTTGTYCFKASNPSAYHDWFLLKAKPLIAVNEQFVGRTTEIKPVPSQASRVKTPLQKAIQLLKRHRDVCFADKPDCSPISIIITTLAAQASSREQNVFAVLNTILQGMENHIEKRNDGFWVANPVMQNENFAERWNAMPQLSQSFFWWIAKAREDFLVATEKLVGLDKYADHFKKILCPQPVDRAFNKLGDVMRENREGGTLKLTGLTSGLSYAACSSGTTVRPHTFFGK